MITIVIAVIVTILIIQVMIQMAGIMVAVVLFKLIMLNKIVPVTAASPEHCHHRHFCHNTVRNVMMLATSLPIMIVLILMTRIVKMAPIPSLLLLLYKNVIQTIFLYPRHKKIPKSVGRRIMGRHPAEMTQDVVADAAVIMGVTVLLNLLVHSLPRKIVLWKR